VFKAFVNLLKMDLKNMLDIDVTGIFELPFLWGTLESRREMRRMKAFRHALALMGTKKVSKSLLLFGM